MTITAPTLAISPQKVCSFIAMACEFGAADAICDGRLNGDGEAPLAALAYHAEGPTFAELASFIDALSEGERIDLVVLTWLGRGDGTLGEWDQLREEAGYFHNKRTSNYLLAKPMLVDHLSEGLAQFGCHCDAVRSVMPGKQYAWEHLFASPSTAPR